MEAFQKLSPVNKFVPLSELINLKDKKAIVTGGAMGIGYAVAYRLAEAGAVVTILDLNLEKGQEAVTNLLQASYQALFIYCDVSRFEESQHSVIDAAAKMGGLDILVNNAGIFPFTPFLELNAGDIEKVLAVNLKGLLLLSQAASRLMITQNRGGCIINLASIDSVHPSHKGLPVYDASKGAVLTLTKSLARELGPHGIRVNAIAPGGILTEGAISQSRARGETGRGGLKEFMARVPLGKMGTADDVGRVALFLASELAGYVTGSLVVVDGGYLLS
jgi:NAD(P)-dependent dehydrogenase (short-subunit alcohol dehydrogenase family)